MNYSPNLSHQTRKHPAIKVKCMLYFQIIYQRLIRLLVSESIYSTIISTQGSYSSRCTDRHVISLPQDIYLSAHFIWYRIQYKDNCWPLVASQHHDGFPMQSRLLAEVILIKISKNSRHFLFFKYWMTVSNIKRYIKV